MQHDHRLHPVARTVAPPPGMHPRRILELEVWIGHIDRVLASSGAPLAFDSGRLFLRRLERDDAATVHRTASQTSIQMLGISATASGSDYAVLRNWQIAALARIKEAGE
jgi:hypothetical protein